MKKYKTLSVLIFFCASLNAQSSIDAILTGILASNKALRAEAQRVEAVQKELQTGLWPYDPAISFDYMRGFPETAGNQSDLTISQSFDFPSAYARRRELASLRSAQTAFESAALRQSILLEAKLTCLQLVFLNRKKSELARRIGHAEQFLAAMQKKYDALDATALDLNKAGQQVIRLKTSVRLTDTEISGQLTMLAELNGGQPIPFSDTLYPPAPELPPLDELQQAFAAADPVLNFFKSQQNAGEAEIALAKALALPKMEAGYRYQGILGQNFHGLHMGITVPLWENKNRIAQRQLQSIYYAGQLEEHRNRNQYDLMQLYQHYRDMLENLDQYRQNLRAFNSSELLDKALQAGQISTLEFFLEQSLLCDSRDQVLELERAVEVAAAKLWKYLL